MKSALELNGVRHAYGERGPSWSIDGLRLDIGQSAACTGSSGSGKTTLLELIAGLQSPSAGHVETLGKAWAKMNHAARQAHRLAHLGLVFQGFELVASLTARENILLPLHLLRRPRRDERFEPLVQTAGLAALLDRKPGQLSHGERQRVALCRALIHGPRLILADEPTANLDAHNRELVRELLLQPVIEQSAALVCVTHDAELTQAFELHWDMHAMRREPASR